MVMSRSALPATSDLPTDLLERDRELSLLGDTSQPGTGRLDSGSSSLSCTSLF
jgi:hypothetical protein